jgi:drug/metabolite transporter (DMT)-like permease
MERRATLMSLVLIAVCAGFWAFGFLFSLEPNWRALRFLGFMLGGMAAIPTCVLCLYYAYLKGVRNMLVRVATVASGLYGILFISFFAAALSQNPTAMQWVRYAF